MMFHLFAFLRFTARLPFRVPAALV
jgi:hypothetical protein